MKAEEALAISKKYTRDTMIGAGAIKGDKGDKGATGPKGDKGADGTTYTPSIGTVTTVDSGGSASVTVAVDDTTKEAVFSFKIPKGDKGESGGEAVGELENAVGDISTLQVTSVTDLVSAINLLYNSFMVGVTYADKKLTITYRNGKKFAIDISAIITDTKIGEFSDVSDTGITDGQVLAFDASTSKYVPKSIDTSSVLQDAKDYTDDKIAKMTHMGAISVDAKPTYADGTITYVKGGNTRTTTNTETWFYYTVDGTAYQTIWIDAVEFTITVSGSVDFDDFVSKTNDVTSTYTGKNADKTKIPNIGALDALYKLLSDVIGTKVNTSDIVDSLVSDAANKPLSAKQGKALNTSLVGHANNTDIHITSAERTTWNSANTAINNALNASVSGSLAAQIVAINTDLNNRIQNTGLYSNCDIQDVLNDIASKDRKYKIINFAVDNSVTGMPPIVGWYMCTMINYYDGNSYILAKCAWDARAFYFASTAFIDSKLKLNSGWVPLISHVSDVKETLLTLNSDFFGALRYTVKNGVCFVTIENFSCSKSMGSGIEVCAGLPKCGQNGYIGTSLTDVDADAKLCGYLYIEKDSNKLIYNKYSESGNSLYGSFSYPVLEE